jgi:hypothetical protein
VHWADENIIIREKLLVDDAIVEEQDGILFWLSEAPFSKHSLLGYEESKESAEKPCMEQENSFVAESPCIFPLQNVRTESDADHRLLREILSPLDADPSPIVSTPDSFVLDGKFFLFLFSDLIMTIVTNVGPTLYIEKKQGN